MDFPGIRSDLEVDMTRCCRVLIVDDEIDFLEILERRFNRRGYHVVCCHSRECAIRAMNSHDFDIVVCDRTLKSDSGLELVRQLRLQGAGVPIVVMSGHSESWARDDAIEAGATAYLVKPFPLADLETTVERLCTTGAAPSVLAG